MLQISSVLRRALALCLVAALTIPSTFAATATPKLSTNYEITDGLTYTNTITDGGGGRRESFALTLDEGSDVFPIVVQSAGTIYATASISRAIEVGEAMGYTVLGAINSDYFSSSTGVPMGIVVEDGAYLSSPSEFSAIAFNNGNVTLVDAPTVTLTITNETTGVSYDIPHFNKARTRTGGLYLMSEQFSTISTRTTTDGWIVRMEEQDDTPLTVNDSISLTVTEATELSGATTIGENNYILTADVSSGLSEVLSSFAVGDEVTISTTCDNEALIDAQWVSGAGDIMVADGEMTDSTTWQHTKEGRAPRSALGIREDGSTVFFVTDGRSTGYSAGLTQIELAEELMALGCVWAVNMDGGGSSAMAVTLPGDAKPTVQNVPSDGKNRSCATFILLVTDAENSATPEKLALKNDGITVLAGTSITLNTADVVAVNAIGSTVASDLGEITFSGADFGSFDGATYTAGKSAGNDAITIKLSNGLEGTAVIHVVDSLTDLTVSRADNGTEIINLAIPVDETETLNVTGNYWLRPALYDATAVQWETNGLCTIDEKGVLTPLGGAGTITATIGGISKSFYLSTRNIHNDVPKGNWAYDVVAYCYDNAIVSGTTPTTFGPALNISRGDFVQILYNAMGRPAVTDAPPFSDVNPTAYYANAITWASKENIVAGSNGQFYPTTSITRAQAFAILARALDYFDIHVDDGDLGVLHHYADHDQIVSYAVQPSATLVENRLVSGSGNLLNPNGTLTRAEMAVLIERFMTFDPDAIVPLEPPVITPTSLTLDRTDLVVLYGEQVQLTATALPIEANTPITWASSDTSIATVTNDGLVIGCYTGIGQPSATITATSGTVTTTCTVRCRPDDGTGTLPETTDPEVTNPEVPKPEVTEPETTLPEVAKPVVVCAGTVVDASGGLNLRAEASSSGEILSVIPNESVVAIRAILDGWYQVVITDEDNKILSGYVSSAYIQQYDAHRVTDATVLNVRDSASTDGVVLTQLKEGDIVYPVATTDGWCTLMLLRDGAITYGYSSADYMIPVQ